MFMLVTYRPGTLRERRHDITANVVPIWLNCNPTDSCVALHPADANTSSNKCLGRTVLLLIDFIARAMQDAQGKAMHILRMAWPST